MTIQGVLATLVPVLGLIGALMLFLIRESKDAGRRESKLDKLLDEVHDVKRHMEKIPVLETRVGQVELAYETIRSDVKELLRRGRERRPSWHDKGEE